ncbi:MAG: hypothetical protein IJW55_07230 [Clostridia bacterium]|nr:hypothetical protein [Clostridia bacterium]
MKKNAVARMTAPKETAGTRFRKLNILPRFLCLLLALVVWLAVVNIKDKQTSDDKNGVTASEQSE